MNICYIFIFTPHCIRFNKVLAHFRGGGERGEVREYLQSKTFWDVSVNVATVGTMGTLLTWATVKALTKIVTRA